MSGSPAEADRFARELDAEWLRQELAASLSSVEPVVDEDALVRALIATDPLAPRRRWIDALGELFATWPGRFALAGVTCALVVVGFVGGQLVPRPVTGVATPGATNPTVRIADGVTELPPTPIYSPENVRRLGVTGNGRASDEKLAQAMVSYGRSDFVTHAVPLLREAIALDADNDRAHFWLGVALLLDRRAAEAIVPLEHATRLAPRSAVYKHYLVFAYMVTGAVDKALAAQMGVLRAP